MKYAVKNEEGYYLGEGGPTLDLYEATLYDTLAAAKGVGYRVVQVNLSEEKVFRLAIFDNVTSEWLQSYEDGHDFWTGEERPTSLVLFDDRGEAEKLIARLEDSFRKFVEGEQKIDFSIRRVTQRKYFETI